MGNALDRLVQVAHALSRCAEWVAGFLVLVAALLIGLDISLRVVANTSTGLSLEFSNYTLAIASSWGATVALMNRSHVRIDSVYSHLPARWKSVLDIVGITAFIHVMMLVTWYGYRSLEQSIVSGTLSGATIEIPLAIPQFIWVAGFVVFMFASVVLLLRASLALFQGDLPRVRDLIGARSAEEEVKLEKDALRIEGTAL